MRLLAGRLSCADFVGGRNPSVSLAQNVSAAIAERNHAAVVPVEFALEDELG